MKQLLFLFGLLLFLPGRWVGAQQAPFGAGGHAARPTPVLADSSAVLHQIFERGRHLNALSLGLIASNGITSGIIALYSPYKAQHIVGGIAVGTSTGLLTIAIVNLLRFNRHREREAFEQLRTHQSLRPYVQRTYTLALLTASKPRR